VFLISLWGVSSEYSRGGFLSLSLGVDVDTAPLDAINIAPLLASLIAGVIIPSVVDFVTHSTAPWWAKSGVATGLAALAGAISTTVWSNSLDWKVYVLSIFMAFLATFTSHSAGSSQVVQNATGDFGLFKQSPRTDVSNRHELSGPDGPVIAMPASTVSAVPGSIPADKHLVVSDSALSDDVEVPSSFTASRAGSPQPPSSGPLIKPGGVGLQDEHVE
jgi:hypothetical protein